MELWWLSSQSLRPETLHHHLDRKCCSVLEKLCCTSLFAGELVSWIAFHRRDYGGLTSLYSFEGKILAGQRSWKNCKFKGRGDFPDCITYTVNICNTCKGPGDWIQLTELVTCVWLGILSEPLKWSLHLSVFCLHVHTYLCALSLCSAQGN